MKLDDHNKEPINKPQYMPKVLGKFIYQYIDLDEWEEIKEKVKIHC